MIDDPDVWQAALLLVKRYGDDAMLEASMRADQMLGEGDMAGAETWHRMILNAIERLQAGRAEVLAADTSRRMLMSGGFAHWPQAMWPNPSPTHSTHMPLTSPTYSGGAFF
jgi:hypothetical protein